MNKPISEMTQDEFINYTIANCDWRDTGQCLSKDCFEIQKPHEDGPLSTLRCEGGFGNDMCKECYNNINKRYLEQLKKLKLELCNECETKLIESPCTNYLFTTVNDLEQFIRIGNDFSSCKFKINTSRNFIKINNLITILQGKYTDLIINELQIEIDNLQKNNRSEK